MEGLLKGSKRLVLEQFSGWEVNTCQGRLWDIELLIKIELGPRLLSIKKLKKVKIIWIMFEKWFCNWNL